MRHPFTSLLLLLLPLLAGCASKSEKGTASPLHGGEVIEKSEEPSYPDFIGNAESATYDRDELARNTIYPEAALEDELEGTVVISVFLDKNGEIQEARVIESENMIFNQAAVEAVRKTTFTPAKQNGIPIPFRLNVKIRFGFVDMTDNIDLPDMGSIEEVSFGDGGKDSAPTFATSPAYDPAELARNIVYPKEAEEKGLEGEVLVLVDLDEEGSIEVIKVLQSENPVFNEAAINAVKRTKFTAVSINGIGHKKRHLVPVRFLLK